MTYLTQNLRLWLLVGVTLALATTAVLLPAVPQPLGYHAFADRRAFVGIPNCLDVVSNMAFLLVGVAGLQLTAQCEATAWRNPMERWPYALFFLGVALTAVGSCYYHWAPDNERLTWDRLPMTVAFMSLVSAQVTERVHWRAGLISLVPLVLIGAVSVLYWQASERAGQGNVVPYVVLQAYTVASIPLIAGLYAPQYTRGSSLIGVLGWYGIAKLCELLDRQIFGMGHLVSGHTLKHLAAAMATYWLYRMLQRREVLQHEARPKVV